MNIDLTYLFISISQLTTKNIKQILQRIYISYIIFTLVIPCV